MSLYVLDTDTLTLLQRKHPVVTQRRKATPPAELAITIITVEEQLTGWYARLRQAKRPDEIARAYLRLTETVTFLGPLHILTYTEAAVHRFNALVRLKLNVGRMDLRIAAIALESGAVVVTRNQRDFGRVPGLTIQDWSA